MNILRTLIEVLRKVSRTLVGINLFSYRIKVNLAGAKELLAERGYTHAQIARRTKRRPKGHYSRARVCNFLAGRVRPDEPAFKSIRRTVERMIHRKLDFHDVHFKSANSSKGKLNIYPR